MRVLVVGLGRFGHALAEELWDKGAEVIAHCPVLAIEGSRGNYRLTTTRGSLDARDVDLHRREIRVMGKGGKERVVPLPAAARC